jgi:ppGpp synthetase/RelA/SpoT-type nucleotidyltranferase
MRIEGILEAFDASRAALAERGEEVRAELAGWLAGSGQKVHSVTLRMKSRESLASKLARPDKSYGCLTDVTDLVGVRVITYFEDAVDAIGRIVEARLPVDFEHSADKRRRRDAGAFGYRSLHYVCELGGASVPAGIRFEIQVRTVLEHAWAEIEHDLGYKAREATPAAARRRLLRLAGLLELADQEFVAIRRELDEYAAALPRRIEADPEAVPLDRLSLLALLDVPEVVELDRAIAAEVGKELGDAPFFPEYLLRMLASSGVRTVAEARAGVAARAASIRAMVRPYFAFTFRTWSLSPDHMARVYRGYSLFFLAHAEVLAAPSLGIDKVDRLARLYRELDYPDDERAAQSVAKTLVEALRGAGS